MLFSSEGGAKRVNGDSNRLRVKFHDINNAMQGLSNVIVAMKRDQTCPPETVHLLTATLDRLKASVESARAMAVEGVDSVRTESASSPIERFPVLLIDADPLSRRMSDQRLKALGYETVPVERFGDAERCLQDGREIPLAFIDSLDRNEIVRHLKRLRSIAPELRIIITYSDEETLPDAEEAGLHLFAMMKKPLKAHRLAEVMGGLAQDIARDAREGES